MNTPNKLQTLFVFFVCTTIFAAGCSDANAAESTYLPVDGSCITEAGFTGDGTDLQGLDLPSEEAYHSGDEEIPSTDESFPPGDDPFDVGDDDQWPFFDDSSALMRSPYLGQGPELTPASTAAGEKETDSAERTSGEVKGVDINSADADTLTELPGIGPALAERIVEYRRARSFDNPAELQRVQGIGPATFEDIAPYIRVE